MIHCLTSTSIVRVQSQVDEVIDVMQENISKVIERGERLDDLQDKSGESHRNTCDMCLCVCSRVQNMCFVDLQSKMKLTQTLQGMFNWSLLFSFHK